MGTVTFSIYVVILALFIFHTAASHLLNWAIRKSQESLAGGVVLLTLLEFVICTVILGELLK